MASPRPRSRSTIANKPLGVVFGKRTGRLVEDDDAGTRDKGPSHLDQLLGAHAQVADLGLGPDVGMFEKREGIGNQFAVLAAADEPGPNPFLTEHDVGLDGQIGREGELLIDHGNAARPRIARASRRVGLARQGHRARIGPVRPGEDFHQRALAGAVLADQGADFARFNAERDAVERPRGPERLGDVSHFQ